eukprot:gene11893-13126_t
MPVRLNLEKRSVEKLGFASPVTLLFKPLFSPSVDAQDQLYCRLSECDPSDKLTQNSSSYAGCSSFQDVINCRGILDGIGNQSDPACRLAEVCLQNLTCCCTVDMPYQQKIRCNVRKRDIGYEIFRLNYLCKVVVVQQPNTPGC